MPSRRRRGMTGTQVGKAGRVPDCSPDRQADGHRCVVATPLQIEREQEGEKADDAAEEAHRLRGVHDARPAQLGLFGGVGRFCRNGGSRQPGGQHASGGGRDRAAHQRRLGTDELHHEGRRRPHHESDDAGDE